ncbi:IS30 family transposase [Desulfitibacter alkalitolerans]|uniref:IS30 family transposase n=1 Tax=Desulfitibacter alkalitolerans TaxID=264641 RepID=UPI000488F42C|nr:IS30 family transposase [Desulfitibacter alkalitolerans]
MSQYNNTLEARKNKHLSLRERYRIEDLLREGIGPLEIANRLGRNKRTIEREISKGTIKLQNSDLTYRKEYCADVGQRIYDKNGQNKGPGLKIGNDHKLVEHIERKIIKDKYSPDAVIGEIKAKELKFKTSICTKTLYNYIDQGIFLNITNKDLPVKKDKKKRSYSKVRTHRKLKGTSIEDRPPEIETREEYGHWEMDCVVGKRDGGGPVLLVLSERQRREEIIFKIPQKTQEFVKEKLDYLELLHGDGFKKKFKSITVDNGSEFLDYESLEKSLLNQENKRVTVYYAHPYSSWERGTNENINKLIRRFIPKGSNIDDYTEEDIKRIEHWINSYPRRIFGYRSANDMAA